MPIMHQLTAVLALLFCAQAFMEQTLSVCAHTLKRLAGQGSPLKVAAQTANLSLNGHFLWSGCGARLVGWTKPLSPFLAHSEFKLGLCWSPARTLILVARYEGSGVCSSYAHGPVPPTHTSPHFPAHKPSLIMLLSSPFLPCLVTSMFYS